MVATFSLISISCSSVRSERSDGRLNGEAQCDSPSSPHCDNTDDQTAHTEKRRKTRGGLKPAEQQVRYQRSNGEADSQTRRGE